MAPCDAAKEQLTRAAVLLQKDELAAADEACRRALGINPRFARAMHMRAVISMRRGQHKEALSLVNDAIQIQPDVPAFLYCKGLLLCELDRATAALAPLELALKLQPANQKCALQLAAALRQLGRAGEANAAFKRAISIDDGNATAHYKFAQHLRSIGDHAQALHEFERAAALDPANQLAAFWQSVAAKGTGASASGGGDVPAPPREYIEKLYDGYAAKFEEHLTKGLQYKTHELLVEALVKALPGRLWARCVDLGCGTGLSGVTARPHVEHLTGVDLSKNMIAQARAKGTAVYNRLIVGECAEALMDLGTDLGTEGGKGAERFDLFLSCDVFVYIGDLQPCFTAMAATAAPGAVIAFSVEAMPHSNSAISTSSSEQRSSTAQCSSCSCGAERCCGYSLQPTGRYVHCRAYLEHLCRDIGFAVMLLEPSVIRKQANKPVNGYLIIAQRQTPADRSAVTDGAS